MAAVAICCVVCGDAVTIGSIGISRWVGQDHCPTCGHLTNKNEEFHVCGYACLNTYLEDPTKYSFNYGFDRGTCG